MPITPNEQLLINRMKTVSTSLGWKPISEDTAGEKIKIVIEIPKPITIGIPLVTIAATKEEPYPCEYPPGYTKKTKANRDEYLTGSDTYSLLNSGYEVIISQAGWIKDIWDPVRKTIMSKKGIATGKRNFPWCQTDEAHKLTEAAKKKAVIPKAKPGECPSPCQEQIDSLIKRVTALEGKKK